MNAWIAEIKAWRKETEACLESKEPTTLEVGSVAVHEEAPKEDAALKPIGALKKRHGDRNLAVRPCGQPKKWTQGNGGSRKELVAACRGIARRAIPARRKGHVRQGYGQDSVARGAPKGRTLERKQRTRQEGRDGMRDRDVKEQLLLRKERTTSNGIKGRSRRPEPHLGSRTTLNKTFRKTAELEVPRQILGTSIRLRTMSDWTLWRGRSPPKRKIERRYIALRREQYGVYANIVHYFSS
jgi:hypothetical protein